MKSYWDLSRSRDSVAELINNDLKRLELNLFVKIEPADELLQQNGWAISIYEGNNLVASWGVAAEQTKEDAVAAVAEVAQEVVLGSYYKLWPVCPSHAEPLRPKVIHNDAVWYCDTDRKSIALIGCLC